MKAGDYVYTPRFCTCKIEKVFDSKKEARAEGYTEPTHYRGEYEIMGKVTSLNHMNFAAIQKETCDCNCIDCERYYKCDSKLKISEEDRDYWQSQRLYKE